MVDDEPFESEAELSAASGALATLATGGDVWYDRLEGVLSSPCDEPATERDYPDSNA